MQDCRREECPSSGCPICEGALKGWSSSILVSQHVSANQLVCCSPASPFSRVLPWRWPILGYIGSSVPSWSSSQKHDGNVDTIEQHNGEVCLGESWKISRCKRDAPHDPSPCRQPAQGYGCRPNWLSPFVGPAGYPSRTSRGGSGPEEQ